MNGYHDALKTSLYGIANVNSPAVRSWCARNAPWQIRTGKWKRELRQTWAALIPAAGLSRVCNHEIPNHFFSFSRSICPEGKSEQYPPCTVRAPCPSRPRPKPGRRISWRHDGLRLSIRSVQLFQLTKPCNWTGFAKFASVGLEKMLGVIQVCL